MDEVQTVNERATRGLEAMALLVEATDPFTPAHEDTSAFQIAWGLLAGAHRQAAAVVLMHDKGLGHDTAPNRRALLEHAARIWWLAEDGPDAVISMNRALQRSQAALRRAADAAGIPYPTEIADAVAATEIPSNRREVYNNFTQLMQRVGAPLLAIWLSESMAAHPTLTSAQAFSRFEDGVLTLFAEPDYPQGIDPPGHYAPLVAVVLLWHAMNSFNRLLAGEPWTAALQQIGKDAGIEETASRTAAAPTVT
ncbi:hypothetical protein ACFZC3_15430 [Streptomyces sp. NPDC007903]|uniref:hypothetical protein n=1 Tax=Streptomyces sp. NPDC007903 TaxID=3364786 RepID=UPI0036E855ED